MSWNGRAIRAIIRKDLKQVLQSKAVMLPLVLLPVILLVLMPAGLVLMPRFVDAEELDVGDMRALFEAMPPALAAEFEGLNLEQVWTMVAANYMFAPMFLIVPLMVAVVIASDSIVGERERRTLEGLLYSPISDRDLLAAKVLTAFLPAIAITLASFVVYGLVVNLAGYAVMGRIFFPAPPWWPLVFWLSPAISLAGLSATVLVSSKVSTFMQAQQISGVLVLPVVFLMVAQLSGLLFLSVPVMMVIGLLIWLLGAVLAWLGARTFHRRELIARV